MTTNLKIILVLLFTLGIQPAAWARSCFQGRVTVVDASTHRPIEATMWLTWNQASDDALTVVRVKGPGFDLRRDLSCRLAPPYICDFDGDAGRLDLAFSGDTLMVMPKGELEIMKDDSGGYGWLLAKANRPRSQTLVLSDGVSRECPRLDSLEVGDPPN